MAERQQPGLLKEEQRSSTGIELIELEPMANPVHVVVEDRQDQTLALMESIVAEPIVLQSAVAAPITLHIQVKQPYC